MPSMIPESTYRSLLQLCLLSAIVLGSPLVWAQEIDQNPPVGAIGGAVHVDPFTGTATTSIPIAVPPGRGGVQPDLALVYGSSNGNGWLGVGWKLEKGVIELQTKFGVDYSGNALVFRLSGINVKLTNMGNNEFRAEKGGFSRILRKTAGDGRPYFEVTDKMGKRFIFGSREDTRLASPNNPDLIFRWCLDRVEDVHGNYMTLSYDSDQGQTYLTQIDYTGNANGGLLPTNQIIFHLENRPDAIPRHRPNLPVTTGKRLKTIEIRTHGQLHKAYQLTYTTSADTGHSLLSSVQGYGKDAVIANGTVTGSSPSLPVTMNWQQSSPTFLPRADMGIRNPLNYNAEYSSVGDFNGDGESDVILLTGASWQATNSVYLSQGNGNFSEIVNPIDPAVGSLPTFDHVSTADFTGDGNSDVFLRHILSGQNRLYVSNGDGTFTKMPSNQIDPGALNNGGELITSDFNRDGKSDLMFWWQGDGTTRMFLGKEDGTFTIIPKNQIPPGSINNGGQWTAGDFNGDGGTDLFFWLGFGTTRMYLNNPASFGTFTTVPSNQINPSTITSHRKLMSGDFNADGLTDVFFWGDVHAVADNGGGGYQEGYEDRGGNRLFFGKGDGTFTEFLNPIPPSIFDDVGMWEPDGNGGYYGGTADYDGDGLTNDDIQGGTGDFNGDGRTDMYFRWSPTFHQDEDGTYGQLTAEQYTPWFHLFVSNGKGGFQQHLNFIPPTEMAEDLTVSNRFMVGDFNGNGLSDAYFLWRRPQIQSFFTQTSQATGLLATITNGLGATTSINYTPSTEYENTQLPNIVQTVSQITRNDGNGHVATTTYDYAGGYYHLATREFRGFQYVKVTGQAGDNNEQTITETWFHQGNGDENNPNVGYGHLQGAPYRVKVTDGNGQVYSEVTTTYHDTSTYPPFFAPPKIVVTDTYDGTASKKRTRTTFSYDSYGNTIREDREGDTDTPDDDKTLIRRFSPNETAWIVGLPDTETIYEGLGTANQVAQTNFYYDGTTSCSTPSTNQQPSKGNLTRVVTWLNGGTDPESRMAYDAYGNVICTRDARGNTSTIGYDSSQTFATSATNALGHQTTTSYYGVNGVSMNDGLYGQVRTVTDPNNAITTTKYDPFGRRNQVIQPNGFATTTYYNGFGTVGQQHIQTVTTEGLSTWTNFDGLGRTFKTRSTGTDNNFIVTEIYYDHRGGITQQSLPYFENSGTRQWTKFEHDPLGRTTKTTNPDGSRGLACYDDWVTVTIDANNHRHRTVRDAYDRVVTVQEYLADYPDGCSTAIDSPYTTTTYLYDVLGNLTRLTDAKGNVSTMTYDTLSRKTAMHDPDMGNWTYAYDAAGNLIQQTDAKGQVIAFQYDVLNRRTQKDYVGASNVIYTYDGSTFFRKGRLQHVQDGSGTTTFYYDNMGQVTRTDKLIDGITHTTQTSYDGLGRVLNLTYPDNSIVTHSYNGPQLATVKEGSTTYAAYSGFNAQGQSSRLTLGNGVTTDYTYDPNNYRLKTLKTVKGSLTLQDLNYTFDAGGNVTNLTDTKHGNQILGYDGLDRLTTASGTAYPTPVTYTYDTIGNMLSNSQMGNYTYPQSGPTSVHPHAVSTAGATSYTYDANGNMTSGAGRTINYDYENRPVSITKNGKTTTILYDGDGGRVKKTVNDGSMTTATTYIGKLYVCDGTTAPLACAKMVFAGGQRLAMKQANGNVDYFHPDHLGSTSVLSNESGMAEQELAYFPYGDTRVNTGSNNSTVEEWKLEVGSFAGGNDLHQSSGLGQQTSDTVSNLPTDGSQVYVTLSYKIGGVWDHDDYTYTASNGGGNGSPLAITSPAPGSTLTTNTVTFIGGHTSSSDNAHSLWVGTTFGGNDLSSGGMSNHSKTISNLPNSGTIYVRYYTQVGPNSSDPNDWSSEDHTYTMNVGGGTPVTISPATVTVAGGGQQTFTGAGGVPPYAFVISADTTGGASVNFTTGQYTAGPNPGTSTVHMADSSVPEQTVDAVVTVQASGSPLAITSPVPGSTLTTNTVTFTGGHTTGDFGHSLWVGTTFGSNNLSVGGVTNHSKTVSNLPNSGTIYVRYYTQVGPNSSDPNDWSSEDHTYTMNVGSSTPLTLSPTSATVAGGGQQTFTGAGGVPPYAFVISADTTGGASVNFTTGQYTAGPNPGTSTVHMADSSVPEQTVDAVVTVQASGSPLAITSPVPGSTLTTNTVTFTGGHTTGDFGHSLWVGTTFGSNNLSVGGVTNHSKTVSNLPNSGTIYVRYYTQVGPNSSDPNDWASEDHTYTMNVGGGTPVTISPATVTVAGGGQQTFTGAGGVPPYAFVITADTTGGASVNFTTGQYTAGPNAGTSTVHMADSSVPEQTVDAVVTVQASGSPLAITSPVPGSTLTSNTVTFTGGHTAGDYAHSLWVGTTFGSNNLSVGGVTNHSKTVSGLPNSGTIYVRYYTQVGPNSSDPNDWASEDHTYTMNVGGSASLSPEDPTIHLASMTNPVQNGPSNLYHLDWDQPTSTPTTRVGGGLFSLRFGIPQLDIPPSNPLVHLASHGGAPSTTISPAAGSVLAGSTVTFSWGYTGGGSSGTDVAYKYTGKERDDSTGLYFYEARYYDSSLGRFISADTIVPNPNDPQTLNRYAYGNNNPVLYNDPSGHCPVCIGIAVGAVVGAVAAGIQSDWDIGAVAQGAIIGGIVGGVSGGTFSSVTAPVSAGGAGAGAFVGGVAAGGVGGFTNALVSGIVYGQSPNVVQGTVIGANAAVAGGICGICGAALGAAASGGDPGKAVLYAALAAGLSMGIQAAIDEFSATEQQNHKTKVEIAAEQLKTEQSGAVSPSGYIRLVSSTDPRWSGTIHSPGAAAGNAPGVFVEILEFFAKYFRSEAVDAAFVELGNRLPYGKPGTGTVIIKNGTTWVWNSYPERVPIIQAPGSGFRAIQRPITGTNRQLGCAITYRCNE